MLLVSLLSILAPAQAGDMGDRLESAEEIVWAGFDYSAVRIFDEEQFEDSDARVFWGPVGGLPDIVDRFPSQKAVFTTLAGDWNQAAVNSLVEPLEKALQRDVTIDVYKPDGPTSVSSRRVFFESQYEARNNPPDMDEADVAAMVRRYRTKARKGIGFALVAERFSQPDKEACFWVTWFDLRTKKPVHAERTCEAAGGADFRNRWFKPAMRVLKGITKELKQGMY